MTKPYEYFVVVASGEFLLSNFPSEDMSKDEMFEFFTDNVCEGYEWNLPEDLLEKIYNLAHTLENIYTLGYKEGVESFNQ
mgnify:FL=1